MGKRRTRHQKPSTCSTSTPEMQGTTSISEREDGELSKSLENSPTPSSLNNNSNSPVITQTPNNSSNKIDKQKEAGDNITSIDEGIGEEKDSKTGNNNEGGEETISPILRKQNQVAATLTDSSLALDTLGPLKASTPLKKVHYPTYSFFSLVTEDNAGDESKENVKDKNDSVLNTPELNNPSQKSNAKAPAGLSPPRSILSNIDKENYAQQFSTPRRPIDPISRELESHRKLESPIYMKVNLNLSVSEDEAGDGVGGAARKGKYRLRPRNLFNSGVSIKPFSMYGDNDSGDDGESNNRKEDKDDEDVFFFLQSEDEEDEGEYEEIEGEKKRSSYSGVRGPKADAKALSLVTNCPVSVKWLVDNFEYCPGRSLPRGFVYDQYVLLCNENALEPVNAASFGKLIRSVFPGLKTRRLGTRGNSKYHYNGVYLKQSSALMAILNLVKTQQGLSYDGNGKRGRRVRRCFDPDAASNEFFRVRESDEFVDCSPDEYLGNKPQLEEPFVQLMIDNAQIPQSLDMNAINAFQSIYFSHCQMLLKYFEKFELKPVFDEWKRFWRLKCNEPVDAEGVVKYKDIMSKTTLFKVCSLEATQQYIMSMDLSTYQYIVDILFPCLSKGMPITMVNGLRNFIKDVDFVFYKIMDGYPKKMAETKLRCLRVFVSMCNDNSRVNRMLRTALTTLRNQDNIRAMQSELCRAINFEEIQKHVQLYKTTNEMLLQDTLILSFHSNLDHSANYSVKSWIYWAQQIAQKLVEESSRQVTNGEMIAAVNPFIFWKKTSDRIMGAMVKGNAVSFGVFKGFLTWCDVLLKHVVKLYTSRVQGYVMPIFYYYHILQEAENSSMLFQQQFISIVNEANVGGGVDGSQQEVNTNEQEAPSGEAAVIIPETQQMENNAPVEDHVHMVQDPYSDNVYIFDTSCLTQEQYRVFIESTNNTVPGTRTTTLPEGVIQLNPPPIPVPETTPPSSQPLPPLLEPATVQEEDEETQHIVVD